MSPGHRVLCIDSSPRRLKEIAESLQEANFEVWTANGASDAVCLAAGLHFDALAVDQESTRRHPEVWDCLAETQPELPFIVHSRTESVQRLCGEDSAQQKPSRISELVLALLLLLLKSPALPQPHAA